MNPSLLVALFTLAYAGVFYIVILIAVAVIGTMVMRKEVTLIS